MAAPIRKNLTFLISKHAPNKNASLFLSPNFFSTHSCPNKSAVFDILVHKHDFPPEFASRVSSNLGLVKNPETVDSKLSFLKSSGFSNAHLQKMLKKKPKKPLFLYPTLLQMSLPNTIEPKIKIFQDAGFSPADISTMISTCPKLLLPSLNNNIIHSLSLLNGLLGSNAAVVRAVRLKPQLLQSSVKKKLGPNLEFLKSCGVSMDRIRIIFNGGYGNAFIREPEVIRASVEKTKEMGLNVDSKPFIYGFQTIALMSKKGLKLKLQAFRDMGFSESDILSMFRKEPRVFGGAVEEIRKIIECLVATGKFGISSIVDQPKSLMYSFEKRYKPRIAVLRVLESRRLVENWPSLRELYYPSEAKFSERFVRPYMNEVGDVYMEEMKD